MHTRNIQIVNHWPSLPLNPCKPVHISANRKGSIMSFPRYIIGSNGELKGGGITVLKGSL